MSSVVTGKLIIPYKNYHKMGLLNLFKRIDKGSYTDPTKVLSSAEVDSNWQKIMDLFPTPASGNTDVGKVPALKADKTGFEFVQLTTGSGGNGGGGGGTTSHNLTIIGNGTNSYQNNNLIGATYVFGSIDSQIIMPSTVVLDNSTGTLTFTNDVQTDAIIQIIFNK